MNEQLKLLNMCKADSFMHALTDRLSFCLFFLLDVRMPSVTNELMRDGEKTVNLRRDLFI